MCRTNSSVKKSLPILETHWLTLSMLMVIFERGHGSGRVNRQCSNSEVSSGGIVGSSRGRGWCLAGSAAFASLVCLLLPLLVLWPGQSLGTRHRNWCASNWLCFDLDRLPAFQDA